MHFLAFLNVPYAPRCRIVSVRARGMKSVDLNSTIARLCKRVSTKADRDFKGEREREKIVSLSGHNLSKVKDGVEWRR